MIHQEVVIATLNVCVPNTRATELHNMVMRQGWTELGRETDKSTPAVGDQHLSLNN